MVGGSMQNNSDETGGRSVDGTDRKVQTRVGSQVLETQRRVANPKRGTRERIEDASEGGYKRLFLAAWAELQATNNLIDLRTTPLLTFDTDRWEWEEQNGRLVVQKREAESKYGETLLETPTRSSTETAQDGEGDE